LFITLFNYIITTGYSTLYSFSARMLSNIQKKAAAISSRKNAGYPVSNDGFSTVTRSKTNATNDTIHSNDQSGCTRSGSAYVPTPSQVHNQASNLKSMDPEDSNIESSVQFTNDLNMKNDIIPSQTTKSNSPYREALKTPIQSHVQKASVSSISRPYLEEIKNNSYFRVKRPLSWCLPTQGNLHTPEHSRHTPAHTSTYKHTPAHTHTTTHKHTCENFGGLCVKT